MKKLFVLLALCFILVSCSDKAVENDYSESLDTAVEKYGPVFEAEDGTLISLYKSREKSAYTDDLTAVKDFADKCTVPVYVAFPPRKMDALTSLLPKELPTGHSEYLYRLAENTFKDSSASYVDLYSALRGTEDTYFTTDHHWTEKGAYLAYCEIVSAMGKTPVDRESLRSETLIESFKGSDHTKYPESEKEESTHPQG